MTNPSSDKDPEKLLDILNSIRKEYSNFRGSENPELVLIPMDPHWIHAYWDVTTDGLEESGCSEFCADSRFIIRITKVDEESDPPITFDLNVQGLRNQRNIQVPYDASAYRAELGCVDGEQSFRTLLSSNTVEVPRHKHIDLEGAGDDKVSGAEAGRPLRVDGPFVYWDETLVDIAIQKRLRRHMPGVVVGNLLRPDLHSSSFSSYSSFELQNDE